MSRRRNKNTQTYPKKKKLSCRKRCMRRCRKYFIDKIKKKIFGTPEPFANVEIEEIKSRFNLSPTSSILSVFKNALQRKNTIDKLKDSKLSEIYLDDMKKKYGVKGSKEKVMKNMYNDYRKGTFSASKLQDPNLDLRYIDKKQMNSLLKDYKAAQKNKYSNLNSKDLKTNFNVKKSQEKVLDQMVNDLKAGKLSPTEVTNAREIDPNKLDQAQLNNMLERYQTRPSFVARKFGVKGSQKKILGDFIKDYRKGKLSATKFISQSTFNPKDLSKNQLNVLLNNYAADQEALQAKSKGSLRSIFEGWRSITLDRSLINQTIGSR